MRQSVGATLAIALISISCSDRAPTAPTTTAPVTGPASVRVSGTVVDYVTGRGIPNYTIRWWAGSNSQFQIRVGQLASVTDAGGRFAVSVPVTDNFVPLVDPLLLDTPLSGSIRIPSKSMETNLIVNGGPCAARYGYVYDAVTRLPIAGARVTRAGAATTDANGYYRIDIGCEPRDAFYWGIGTTIISVSHPAYQGAFEFDGRRENTSYSGIRRVDFALQPPGQ